MNRVLGVLGVAALLALPACPAKTDYGQGCKMTKPKGESACVVPIEANEAICGIHKNELTNPSFDYISLGNAECDDQVCLRTGNPAEPYSDESNGNAVGYCTRGCLEDADCQPDYQGKKDLVCDQLLFSDAYMDQLKANCDTDPNCLYNQIFGAGASARYCVKARTTTP